MPTSKNTRFLFGIVLQVFCLCLHAEIVTDNTLGHSGKSVAGPNYAIAADLGQQQGGNLFHSFTHFNVFKGETALFEVGSNVNNIFARITGKEVSNINGNISTGLSGANLWLINPNGWLLGSNANFNINGSLHITTANAIGFCHENKFYADPSQTSQLSIEAPLTIELDKPSSSAEITIDNADIQVPALEIVSFTAPKLNLNQTAITAPDGKILLGGVTEGIWTLDAQQGLKSESLANGSVVLTGRFKNSDGVSTPITTSSIEQSIDGGLIQLIARSVNLYDAQISQSAVSGKQSGSIEINSKKLSLDKGSSIDTDVVESGSAGNIKIESDNLQLSKGSSVSSNSQFMSDGNAGHINVTLKNDLTMTENTSIATYNNGSGKGGAVSISADHINLDKNAAIAVNSNGIGNAGQLTIIAKSIDLTHGGTIDSSTLTAGDGGSIDIQAGRIFTSDPETFITSSSFGEGKGGNVNIQAGQINVGKKAEIRTLSQGTGNAGSIKIDVAGEFRLHNAKVTTQAQQSDGGEIAINADTLFMQHAQITTSVEGSLGDGGNITTSTDNLIMDGGFIQANTVAKNAFGGDILIEAKRLIASGTEVLVGGKKRMQYDSHSRLNVIQAAAEHGVAGNVSVNTVELNVAGQLLPLDSRFIPEQNIIDNPCQILRGQQQLNSLVSVGHGGLPITAVDLFITDLEHYLTPNDLSSLSSATLISELSCTESGL